MTEKASLARRLQIAVLVLARLFYLVSIVLASLQGNLETASVVGLALVLSFLPQLIERSYRVDLPVVYELVIVGFVFASIFMGTVEQAYGNLWWWDDLLHASSGVIMGYVGFLILYVLHRQSRLQTSYGLVALLTFSVGMASAGLWEVFEFSADQLLGTIMQRSLFDTMTDIIVAGLGSLLAAGAAYLHLRWPHLSPLRRWTREFFRSNPTLRKR